MIALLIGMVIGLVLGLTGAGGSVLALPLLMTGLMLAPATAAGFSLGAVALAAGLGVVLRLGKGQIVWELALVLGTAGALCTPIGQWLAQKLPHFLLLTGFTFLVALIAVRMWMQAKNTPADTRIVRASTGTGAAMKSICALSTSGYFEWRGPCVLRLLAVGSITGVLSGLFGVGGGFVIVPALILLTGLSMLQAVATSLAIILVVAAAGFFSFLSGQPPSESSQLLRVLVGSMGGMLLGTWTASRLAGPRLQQFFAVMMLALAVWAWWQQMHP